MIFLSLFCLLKASLSSIQSRTPIRQTQQVCVLQKYEIKSIVDFALIRKHKLSCLIFDNTCGELLRLFRKVQTTLTKQFTTTHQLLGFFFFITDVVGELNSSLVFLVSLIFHCYLLVSRLSVQFMCHA